MEVWGGETVTTAGWEGSEKGPLRPEAWRTTESQKRVLGPLLFETIRHGWNNRERFLAIPNKSNTHASFGAWSPVITVSGLA